MQRTFKLNNYTVHCKLEGIATGGFYEKYTSLEVARSNLAAISKSYGATEATLMLTQHGSVVKKVDPNIAEVKCDALITTSPRHALIMRAADCLPIVIFSKSKQVMGLLHGSRKSLEKGIIENTLHILHKEYSVPSEDLRVYIGPGIHSASYALPSKIVNDLSLKKWKKYVQQQGDNVHLDMPGLTYSLFRSAGVAVENIQKSNIDTAVDRRYYSHYRATRFGSKNGRNAFVAVLTHSI